MDLSPDANWCGETDVVVRATDPGGLSDTDTFHVTVNCLNDPPWIDPLVPAASATRDQPILLDLTAYEKDLEDSGVALDWTITGEDRCTVSGENSDDDLLTLTPQAGYVGSDTVTLHLRDSQGAETTQDVLLTWQEPSSQVYSLDVRVSASDDDAEEYPGGYVHRTSPDLELIYDSRVQTVGMRFAGVAIPQGATIVAAYVQFQASEASSEATSLRIEGQAADNALSFASVSRNITSRSRTSASASWAPAPWTAVGEAGPGQRTPDLAPVLQEIVSRSGWASGNALALIVTGSGRRVAESYNGSPTGAPLLHVEYTTGPVANQAPAVDAGANQAVVLPGAVTLDGTVSDDGLPNPPGAVTATWSQVSGPGTVTFGDENAVDTSASFSAAGEYVLRLTADDGELSSSDEATVTVQPAPANQAPVVDAGPDRAAVVGANVALDGTVSDDGLPNPPGAVTATWSRVSGPGTVTFGDENAVDTSASFSAAGEYVLRLTADDGELSSSDEATITVTDAPANQAPVVDAGPDRAAVVGANVALDGTVSDDGLPNPPGAVTATWSRVSGPGTVTFGDASAVDTSASFSAAG